MFSSHRSSRTRAPSARPSPVSGHMDRGYATLCNTFATLSPSSFGLRHSFVIRHSAFGIAASLHPRNTPPISSTNYQLATIKFPNQTKPPKATKRTQKPLCRSRIAIFASNPLNYFDETNPPRQSTADCGVEYEESANRPLWSGRYA